jgi:bifunctional enzyme CysN/CysC
MSWYSGNTALETIDSFTKEASRVNKAFRFPVQDIYKFTEAGDDRRIIAGRIETGQIRTGDEVVFLPSEKRSKIATIECFNAPVQTQARCGQSTGFTLEQQVYIKPGELMCKTNEQPARVGSHLRANIFWMARQPMIKNKRYKIKLAGTRTPVWLRQIINVLDASDLTTDSNRRQIERHDVAECVLETLKPVAFDTSQDLSQTGRFVIIDNYEIAGGGIILDSAQNVTNRITERVEQREKRWERSSITPQVRTSRYNQRSTLVLICGSAELDKEQLAKALEENLFNDGRFVYYLGLSNSLLGIDANMDISESGQRDEYIRQLGEISHLFTDAGMILITTVSDLDDYELETINTLNKPNDSRVINIGVNRFSRTKIDLQIDSLDDVPDAVNRIKELLKSEKYLIEYYL